MKSINALARAFSLSFLVGCATVDGVATAQSTEVPAGYTRNLASKSYSVRQTVQGEPVRAGSVSERYELRDGDCAESDCVNPRYRSEIRMLPRTTQARIGKDIWYGWSFYNENIQSYSSQVSLMNVFGQWKMGGSNPPSIKFVQVGRGEAYRSGNQRHDVVLQLDDANEGLNWGARKNWGIVCRLFSIDEVRGKWTDIVMNTNFSTGEDGYIRVWINGQQRCNYTGPITVTTDQSLYPGPNHRRGIYVSFTKRWDTVQADKPKPTMIAYYDEFRVGQSRDEVDVRVRENHGLPPLD